jgi:hypothetical protein
VSIARSEILRGNETYRQKPSQIDQLLLQQLMQELGLPTGEQLAAPRRLGDYEQRRHIPVIEGLLAAGCDYILYGVAGCGKTTMALLLARAVIGYPGYSTFLDYPPVSGFGWQNRRVLYIASDGDENAPLDLSTYTDRMMMDHQEWVKDNLHVISNDPSGQYARWTMTVANLINLSRTLQDAQRCGKPYGLVIFDTLKAICPDDMRVGDQAITDYIRVIRRICGKFNAAAIYLHHQSRDNESPQGAMGIPEMVHGVYRLTRREGRPVFEVRKTRLDDRGSRDIYYQLEAGVLEVDTNFTPEDKNRKLMPGVQLEEDVMAAHRRHQDDHYLDGGTDADYPGIRPHDLPDFMEVYGYKVSNRLKVTEKARSLRKLGYLERIPSTKGYRIADASEEAARSRQGDLRDADSGSIPGWD